MIILNNFFRKENIKMRSLDNTTNKEAELNGWKIIKSCSSMEVIAKAIYTANDQNIMKSTKRFKVPGGWIYNTSTEHILWDYEKDCIKNVAIAEAIIFVPNNNLKK